MELQILEFFNRTLAHPALDVAMVGLTTVGLALLPAIGAGLLASARWRRTGIAVLAAMGFSLLLALAFQYLTWRPRPENVRLVLAAPNFPAFPSGHTALAFAFATVTALAVRRWTIGAAALLFAGLIGVSRVYLGHHYPSDVLAGAALGSAVGAAGYGILGRSPADWRWLLWPQLALVVVITQIAYLGFLPLHLLRWPMSDKVLHFLLFGAVVFWLNLWLNGRAFQAGRWAVPLALILPLSAAILEEGAQSFSPLRTADVTDLVSDVAGMLFFLALSTRFIRSKQDAAARYGAG
ncbi:MAG: phosphatase PAP2 family protein [Chloroflexi bacterium]|nr:MAG: phosphatase PAP2 family protein [Chloroflexota bacterium]